MAASFNWLMANQPVMKIENGQRMVASNTMAMCNSNTSMANRKLAYDSQLMTMMKAVAIMANNVCMCSNTMYQYQSISNNINGVMAASVWLMTNRHENIVVMVINIEENYVW